MYSLLIPSVVSDDEYRQMPEAVEPEICTNLYFQREPLPDVSFLTFRMGKASLASDFLTIRNTSSRLCSSRFLDILREMAVPFSSYPARVLDMDTGEPMSNSSYSFWFPQRLVGTIDWQRSEETVNGETGERRLTNLVLVAEYEVPLPLLFRTREQGYCLVHEVLRQRIEEANIRGVAFVSLQDVYSPYSGIDRQVLEDFLKTKPYDLEKWCELSDTFVLLHHYQEALDTLEKIFAINANFVQAWARRGHIFHIQGRIEEASDALKYTLELAPHLPLWSEYSQVLRALGRNEEALTAAERAIQIHPKSPTAQIELIASYVTLGLYYKAISASHRVLAQKGLNSPLLATLRRMKGEALSSLKRYEEALSEYSTGLKWSPRDRKMLEYKIQTLRVLGLHEEAFKEEEKLHELEERRQKNLRKRPI